MTVPKRAWVLSAFFILAGLVSGMSDISQYPFKPPKTLAPYVPTP